MALIRFDAIIKYNTGPGHPDEPDARGLSFPDVYTIDPDRFNGSEHIRDYITEDLLLVAGGGYNWDHVKKYNVTISQE